VGTADRRHVHQSKLRGRLCPPEAGAAGTKQGVADNKHPRPYGQILDDPPIHIRPYVPAIAGVFQKTLWVLRTKRQESIHKGLRAFSLVNALLFQFNSI
jgi:hypothetical protein